MQWPGTKLRRSAWFADVQQSVIERRLAMSTRDYIGHLSTISAYLGWRALGRGELVIASRAERARQLAFVAGPGT
jgi:hypothetical protein